MFFLSINLELLFYLYIFAPYFNLKGKMDFDDFMDEGHFIDEDDKVAAKLFWENVIFKNQTNEEEKNEIE